MERAWLTRLRWRMRGALMWPAFVALTIADAVLLRLRPPLGDGTGVVPALLLATFFNLLAIVVLAPLAGRALRRLRPDLPRVVARDDAGAVLLVAILVAIAAGGALHHAAITRESGHLADAEMAVHRYVVNQAPAPYRERLAWMDVVKLEDGLYRACVPGSDPERPLCLFVRTSQSPPGVRVDPSREGNRAYRLAAP